VPKRMPGWTPAHGPRPGADRPHMVAEREDLTVADLQMVESNEAFSNGARGPDPLSAVR